jgi:hypothetical protein
MRRPRRRRSGRRQPRPCAARTTRPLPLPLSAWRPRPRSARPQRRPPGHPRPRRSAPSQPRRARPRKERSAARPRPPGWARTEAVGVQGKRLSAAVVVLVLVVVPWLASGAASGPGCGVGETGTREKGVRWMDGLGFFFDLRWRGEGGTRAPGLSLPLFWRAGGVETRMRLSRRGRGAGGGPKGVRAGWTHRHGERRWERGGKADRQESVGRALAPPSPPHTAFPESSPGEREGRKKTRDSARTAPAATLLALPPPQSLLVDLAARCSEVSVRQPACAGRGRVGDAQQASRSGRRPPPPPPQLCGRDAAAAAACPPLSPALVQRCPAPARNPAPCESERALLAWEPLRPHASGRPPPPAPSARPPLGAARKGRAP